MPAAKSGQATHVQIGVHIDTSQGFQPSSSGRRRPRSTGVEEIEGRGRL